MSSAKRERLLVLGTGFGARHFLQRVDAERFDVTLVSPRNHFLFTPLLPSTTVGTVEFRTIIEPIRNIRHACTYYQGSATSIDTVAKEVECTSADGRMQWRQAYDRLIIAVGAVTNTLGVPGVEEFAFVLKELSDARRIRHQLIDNLERAALPGIGLEEQRQLLHFIVVGGGPTGVRFAAEFYDLLAKDLSRHFAQLRELVKVSVLDSSDSLLSSYDQHLRDHVRQVFARRGIQFEPRAAVSRVSERGVELTDGRRFEGGLVLWSVGFSANPLLRKLEWPSDRSGRLLVDDYLRVRDQSEIYALGDCAALPENPLPQLAQVAAQQGDYLASAFNLPSGQAPAPFRWKNRGYSSYIGRSAAVVDAPEKHEHSVGYWAYQSWRISIWSELLSWRSRIWIPLDRLRAAIFGRDLSQF